MPPCGQRPRAERPFRSRTTIDLRSEPGERLLLESDGFQAFVPLSVNFLTQKNQAFCGVASIVMVLNALQVPAPTTPEYEPYVCPS